MASKKRTAGHYTLEPDPIYGSKLASKFINCLMYDGKKSVAQQVFYRALDQVGKKMGAAAKPIEVFEQAIENVKPTLEVRSRRVGGATYQVPVPVSPQRKQSLSFRWVLGAARGKKGKPMYLRLAEELMAAYRREGEAMSKRDQTIKMADANKAFSHFAW